MPQPRGQESEPQHRRPKHGATEAAKISKFLAEQMIDAVMPNEVLKKSSEEERCRAIGLSDEDECLRRTAVKLAITKTYSRLRASSPAGIYGALVGWGHVSKRPEKPEHSSRF